MTAHKAEPPERLESRRVPTQPYMHVVYMIVVRNGRARPALEEQVCTSSSSSLLPTPLCERKLKEEKYNNEIKLEDMKNKTCYHYGYKTFLSLYIFLVLKTLV